MSYDNRVSSPVKPGKNAPTIPALDPAMKSGGRIKFERRVTLLALGAGFPAVGLCAFLLWYDNYSAQIQWTVDLLLTLVWLGISFNLKPVSYTHLRAHETPEHLVC